ncbi:MAG: hypothetical protein IT366_22705 [Candidatus Hydrogenedentes bacterium]|nr:hypothetical protein [Candidatus Hydrogenedentota bacterium]
MSTNASMTQTSPDDVRSIDGQGVYFVKAPAAVVPGIALKDEDLVVSVNAYPVTTVESLAKAITDFVSATRAAPEQPHMLYLDVVNRYDRLQYTITITAL